MIHDNNAATITRVGAGAPAGVPSPVATPGPSTRHVLVVDDDPSLRGMLAKALLDAGYRVTCAEDGQGGWDQLCASTFDAMITDHDMPRLTGLGLLRRVRAGPSLLPVIVISGDMPWQELDFERLLPPGLAIDKPFELRKFLVSVRDTFGGPLYSEARRGDGGPGGCAPSCPPGRAVALVGAIRSGPSAGLRNLA